MAPVAVGRCWHGAAAGAARAAGSRLRWGRCRRVRCLAPHTVRLRPFSGGAFRSGGAPAAPSVPLQLVCSRPSGFQRWVWPMGVAHGWPRRAGWVAGCLAGASCDPGPTFPLAAPAASMHWQRQRLAVASGASLAMCCTLLKAPCSPCRSHRPAAAVPGLPHPQASGHRLGATLNCRSRAAAAQGGAEGSSERKASIGAGGAGLAGSPSGLGTAAAGSCLAARLQGCFRPL